LPVRRYRRLAEDCRKQPSTAVRVRSCSATISRAVRPGMSY
jgi:hypothetical protein